MYSVSCAEQTRLSRTAGQLHRQPLLRHNCIARPQGSVSSLMWLCTAGLQLHTCSRSGRCTGLAGARLACSQLLKETQRDAAAQSLLLQQHILRQAAGCRSRPSRCLVSPHHLQIPDRPAAMAAGHLHPHHPPKLQGQLRPQHLGVLQRLSRHPLHLQDQSCGQLQPQLPQLSSLDQHRTPEGGQGLQGQGLAVRHRRRASELELAAGLS